jgi:DnaJ-class molecular chaperone
MCTKRCIGNLISWCRIKPDLARERRPVEERGGEGEVCATCNGRGTVLSAYGAICTEPIEKLEPCPDCRGRD